MINHCINCKDPLFVSPKTPYAVNNVIDLGQGNTPVIRLKKIGLEFGVSDLWAKLEYLNPTGSFKDRGSATLISALYNMKISNVAEDSSGNAGASIAAYSAKAGISAHIFVPASAPSIKLSQIAFYDAVVHRIAGGRKLVARYCQEFCLSHHMVYASHNLSPFFIEGTKQFAYELTKDLDPLPKHILFPTGNGSLLLGAWRGFSELGLQYPKLYAIQSELCNPIASRFSVMGSAHPNHETPTIAGGIAVENPPRLKQCLQAIRTTKGQAISVTEQQISVMQGKLAALEGLLVEPTSAAGLAGLPKLLDQGYIKPNDRVLIPLTGFGFKDKLSDNGR
jgi:threonine synthase